ncbi:MAG: hypothetical protein ABH816_03175 [Candidatus Levyibacteriota bacterium]
MRPKLEIDFEHFAVMLFGDRYYQYCNWNTESNYKKLLKEIAHQLEIVINSQFTPSDGLQKQMIEFSLEKLQRSPKKSNYEAYYIKELVTIIFWILGDFPNNWQRKNLRGKKIDNFHYSRSLHYSQTLNQKINTILEAHRLSPFSERISWHDLIVKIGQSGGRDKFIDFYKKTYPDLYLKLF